MRRAAALAAMFVLAACSGGSTQKARLAAHDDLSAVQAVQRSERNGKSGAPVNVVFVSGTITNPGSSALRCSANAFLLVDPKGNAVAPARQWCDVPAIAPKQSAFFSATFPATATDNLQLRYEHPDGSYEVHDLAIPPA